MESDLKSSFRKSVKWTATVSLFNTITQPVYRVFLAILLLPSEYAYIAVITLIVSLAELLNNVGVGEAVIQRDKVFPEDISTLFYFNLFLSIAFSVLTYSSASLLEQFYDMTSLSIIVKILSVVVFMNGATSLFKFYLHKNFMFNKTSVIKLVKLFLEIVISIILIVIGLNIYGYVIGVVLANIVHSILLVISAFKYTDFKLKLYFSFNKLKSFLEFGIFVGLKKIITFVSQRADEIIVGGALSSEVLGTYFLAKTILVQIQTLITSSFGQVLLPTFSKLKHNFSEMKKFYLQVIKIVAYFGIPMFVFIMLSAEHFVVVFLGQEWSAAIIVFEWLAIPTLCLLLSAGITTSLLYAVNKTKVVLLVDLILVPVYLFLLYILHSGSLINILIIYSSYIMIKFILIQVILSNIFGIKIREVLKNIKSIIVSVFITVLIIMLIKNYLNRHDDIMSLTIYSLISFMIYFIVTLIFNRDDTIKYINLVKSTLTLKGK
ncbi:oligosaccharide flippase family protein [Salinicoccus roseus]|uniref:oligosaccharide flippase family protein n=1 Tax=Salinicoccus roseus TaxID=45670 RepID=UPI003DA0BF1E